MRSCFPSLISFSNDRSELTALAVQSSCGISLSGRKFDRKKINRREKKPIGVKFLRVIDAKSVASESGVVQRESEHLEMRFRRRKDKKAKEAAAVRDPLSLF